MHFYSLQNGFALEFLFLVVCKMNLLKNACTFIVCKIDLLKNARTFIVCKLK